MEQKNRDDLVSKIKSNSKWLIVLLAILFALNIFKIVINILNLIEGTNLEGTNLTESERVLFFHNIFSSVGIAIIYILAFSVLKRLSKDGSPFSEKNFKTMRLIAILLLLNAVVPNVLASICIGNIFADFSAVSNSNDYTTKFVILGTALELVIDILHYGVLLQKQSDETL